MNNHNCNFTLLSFLFFFTEFSGINFSHMYYYFPVKESYQKDNLLINIKKYKNRARFLLFFFQSKNEFLFLLYFAKAKD